MAEYLNKYDTTAQYTAESKDRAALGDTVSLVTLDGKVYYDRSTVKIGDKVYNVVRMPDGKRWLAQNLAIPTTNSRERSDYPEFGYYYPFTDINEVKSSLPQGWRIPTRSDWEGILGNGSASIIYSLQATGYSKWPNATNSTGLAIVPSRVPNATDLSICYTYVSDLIPSSQILYFRTSDYTFGLGYNTEFYTIRLVKD